MSNLTVRQGNDLIEASYKIASLGEARLIRLLIAQISPSDEDFKTYQISVTDFARVFNLNGRDSSVYDMVEKSAEDLIRRIITIKDGKSWYKTSWLSSAKYVHGSGIVELRFDKDLKPHLLGLKSYFTQYDLEHTVHFKSLYSVRLFEIMQKEAFKASDQGYFKRSFEYEELREKMGIEKDEYNLFANFKARVIETAQKEINKFSSLNIIQVDYPKTGRKVTHVVFHVEKKKQITLELKGGSPNLTEKAIEPKEKHPVDVLEMISMGIDERTAYKWRKNYTVNQVVRNIAYTRAMQEAKKIKTSVAGYLARAIADDLASGWEKEQQERDNRAKAEKEAQGREKHAENERAEKIKSAVENAYKSFLELGKSDQEKIKTDYLAQAMPAMKKTFAKNGNEDRFFRDYLVRYFENV
jgi:plasmid replication initiation protein